MHREIAIPLCMERRASGDLAQLLTEECSAGHIGMCVGTESVAWVAGIRRSRGRTGPAEAVGRIIDPIPGAEGRVSNMTRMSILIPLLGTAPLFFSLPRDLAAQ